MLALIKAGADPAILAREFFDGEKARFDLAGVVYGLLHGWDEDLSPARDAHGRFDPAECLIGRAGLLDLAVCDRIRQAAAVKIRDSHRSGEPVGNRWNGKAWAFSLSFDVDSAGVRHGLDRLRNLRRIALTGRARQLPKHLWQWSARLLGGPDPDLPFETIFEELARRGVRATFLTQTRKLHKLDNYDLARATELSRFLRRAQRQGHEVGLHGSYATPDAPRSHLAHQRLAFERMLGPAPTAHRGHYLRVTSREHLEALADQGFAVEGSLGFATREGFRRGTCQPIAVRGPETGKVMVCLPLIAMDVTLRSHRGLSAEEAFDRLVALMGEVRRAGGVMSLLWHPHNFNGWFWPPEWRELPWRCLDHALESGAYAGTMGELAQAFRDS
ncbi:MAG: hypothetical protein RLY93_15250 [Sumerlaeia bacterium]